MTNCNPRHESTCPSVLESSLWIFKPFYISSITKSKIIYNLKIFVLNNKQIQFSFVNGQKVKLKSYLIRTSSPTYNFINLICNRFLKHGRTIYKSLSANYFVNPSPKCEEINIRFLIILDESLYKATFISQLHMRAK